jgi:hypothetical protein
MTRRRFLLLAALTLLHSALNACTPPPNAAGSSAPSSLKRREECLRRAGGSPPAPHSSLSFLTPFRTASALRRGPGKGCRLSTEPGIVCFRPRTGQRAAPCPKPQGGKHYRGPRGSSDSPCRPATLRDSHKECLRRAGDIAPAPIHLFLSSHPPYGLKRGVVGRARAVGCPTEPGIVCFPAAYAYNAPSSGPKLKAGKHYEAAGSSGRPCPARDATRPP